MTRAFLKYRRLAIIPMILLANDFHSCNAFYKNSRHNILYADEQGIAQLPDEFCLFTPTYANPVQVKDIKPVTYSISKVNKAGFIKDLPLGTHLCSFETIDEDAVSSVNLYKEGYTIIQLIKKESEGYIGYLEELLGVPFVLPPRWLNEGHQTDLRLGVDCAELAIYGQRRLGYKIPYCGPRRLIEYLQPTEKAGKGVIVSFANNYQISVLYEDRGIAGVLDEDDLLIHAYRDKAEIVRLGDTELKNYPYKLYVWKEYHYSFTKTGKSVTDKSGGRP